MFASTGYNATTFSLDLPNWNVSSCTVMRFIFGETGYNATSWIVKISSKTETLSNTTSRWYCSDGRYIEPESDQGFTLS